MSEVARLLDMVDQFFGDIEFACTFGPYAKEFRVRQTDLVDNTLAESLHTVESIISSESDKTDNESLSLELGDLARKLRAARAGVAEFLDLGQDGHVYWVEKAGHDGGIISLNGAPVNVAELLKDILFAPGRPCVLTSATLGTGDEGLSYFRRRVGGTDAVAEKIGSPFDYRRQMKLYLVRRMPAPNESGFEDALVHWIGHFIQETQGRAFVLFTSYRLLRSVADRMENFFDREGITLLTQGSGMPRHQLIEEFKEDTHSVLFGTDSFWTGVDVPGEALSNVIITRLPFAVPDHPLTAARLEEIESRGGNSFMEYSVPEAILKLRQGIGRLIRSGRDKGIAVILDNRVLTKQYGRAFLAALPECPREVVG
ncbi:MAG: helicase C-terminal domain-containing protein [Verrucomicrobiales bacterium]